MIKKILIGVDGSEHFRTTQAYAFYIARKLDAALIGLHVADIVLIKGHLFRDIVGPLAPEQYQDFPSKMQAVLTQRGQTVLDDFAQAARREGVTAETVLEVGIVANQICEHAKSADLVMIGRRGMNEGFSTGLLGLTAESVARKCPRPLFISPLQFREIKRPVFAYDGSERSSHAMHAAADFAASFGLPLTVITVAVDPEAMHVLDKARKYLEPYRPPDEFKLLTGYTDEEIVRFIQEQDADLLFIGAYGERRIVEMVLGSTTEYVLRNAPCPVFLSR